MPRQGRILLSIDYVQCELRIMAHFSQDATLISLLQVNIRKLNTSN
jgi:DNA polymerase I-like protein with 3'-5' exonuclease and polymerase domains